MASLQIFPSRLEGKVRVSGAKNSSLRQLAASLLTSETVTLLNAPTGIDDFRVHVDMLEKLGKTVTIENSTASISEKNTPPSQSLPLPPKTSYLIPHTSLNWEGRSIRGTLLILGALLARHGYGRVPLPGGCNLGDRKYDLHVHAMERLGARVWEEDNYLCAESKSRLLGTDIHLALRSTGATENAILMGVLAEGATRIWNPHIRPEILDLVLMLNRMGAHIRVNGQESIEIEGVEGLRGVEHTCIPDNMEALTWVIAAAITGGEVEVQGFPFGHLEIPLIHLRESGLQFFRNEKQDTILVKKSRLYPVDICTGPYPAINSDMQPLFAVWGLMARGESRIIDLRFPGRYQYAEEFARLGGDTRVEGDLLRIFGGKPLHSATVTALDLRAGAALTLAGLVAEGGLRLENFEQVERGYEDFVGKLRALGGHVEMVANLDLASKDGSPNFVGNQIAAKGKFEV